MILGTLRGEQVWVVFAKPKETMARSTGNLGWAPQVPGGREGCEVLGDEGWAVCEVCPAPSPAFWAFGKSPISRQDEAVI